MQSLPRPRLWPMIVASVVAPASGLVLLFAFAWLFGPAAGRGLGNAVLLAPAAVMAGVWRWRQAVETSWTPLASTATAPVPEVRTRFRPTLLDVAVAVAVLLPVVFFGLFAVSPVVARTVPGVDVRARTAGCFDRYQVAVRTLGELPTPPVGDRYVASRRLCAAARGSDGVALTAHVVRIAGHEVLVWVRTDRGVWENDGVALHSLVFGLGGLAAAIVFAMYGLRAVYRDRIARRSLARHPLHHPGGTGIVVSRGAATQHGDEWRYSGVRWLLDDGLLTSREPIAENDARIGARRVFAADEVDEICRRAHGRWTGTADVTAYRVIHGLFGVTLELRHRGGGTQHVGVDFAYAVHPDDLAARLEHRPAARSVPVT